MAWLSALLPVPQAVACVAALNQGADSLIATGEARTRDQVKADLLVERLTGQTSAGEVPVEVQLLMPADVLLDPDGVDGHEPVHVAGYGPVPAGWARDFLTRSQQQRTWLRRLFTRPGTGELIGMESQRRLFTKAQREFITARDQYCRTPWCGAPIRHIDHVVPAEDGGPTSVDNGQGLCAACNYAKQALDWTARPGPGADVVTTTPTGHDYRSSPPRPPGTEKTPLGLPSVQVDLRYFRHRLAA
jgi:hypothetical protein